MKILISLLIIGNVMGASGVGYGGDLRVSLPLVEVRTMSGEGYGGNLRTLGTGDYDFDSQSNRWFLKTKSRLLSVSNIELIDKFKDTNDTIERISARYSSFKENRKRAIVEKKIKRLNIVKPYKLDDFIK